MEGIVGRKLSSTTTFVMCSWVFERDGRTIILGSDRDGGLWIFEDTGS
jgi:hypothetical protein